MNKIEIKINATLENEAVVRNTMGLFAATINCTIEDIIDIKTIVSEAVSNAIIHGYEQDKTKEVIINGILNDNELVIVVKDEGVGIENIAEALRVNFSSSFFLLVACLLLLALAENLAINSWSSFALASIFLFSSFC